MAAGERVIGTSDGEPVAELRPLPRQPLSAATVCDGFKRLPPMDPDRIRARRRHRRRPVSASDDRRGVLDTSTLILVGQLDPDDVPAEPVITAVTLAELSVGPIAATALANQLDVWPCNPKDFDGVDGPGVVSVPHPATG